ncbi:hybrid sensor histidine kinase/response regulator [Nitrogeniibacter aestuarii]|uniref:hybrid sensor histidine kinase/response regulator n=1 Tax=Nitrogeniibacter aestuarii TaxID=2815343 RepID=UPI001D1175FE|nr:hybrid sensor histidine kinase/response regulator [Nitrogeniibacter aestuarii]
MSALAQEHPAQPGAEPEKAKATILVVEDSPSMRSIIAACLSGAGYSVLTAENGWQGSVMAEEHLPDLILSDVEMPEVDGFALLAHLRENPKLALTPVIMLTSLTDRSNVRRAMSLGAEDFLFKPFDPDTVLEAVSTQLNRHASRKAAAEQLDEHMINILGSVLPHEFRTPLNVILGYGDLMGVIGKDGLSPEMTQEFSREIVQAGKRLLSQTNRFLTLSHLHGDRAMAAARRASTEVNDALVESVVEDAVSLLPENMAMMTDVSVVTGMVAADAKSVRDVLFELVTNGLKFSDRDTPVVIAGRPMRDGYYQLAVENIGQPFPIDHLEHVGNFRQFNRTINEQQGVGIGLAIVSATAERWGGDYHVENLPEGIVRVSVRFPLAGGVVQQKKSLRAVS